MTDDVFGALDEVFAREHGPAYHETAALLAALLPLSETQAATWVREALKPLPENRAWAPRVAEGRVLNRWEDSPPGTVVFRAAYTPEEAQRAARKVATQRDNPRVRDFLDELRAVRRAWVEQVIARQQRELGARLQLQARHGTEEEQRLRAEAQAAKVRDIIAGIAAKKGL